MLDELRAISFALSSCATSRPAGRANQRQVDATQEDSKLAGCSLHLRRVQGDRHRDSERASVQTAIPNPVPTVGMPEQFQVRPALVVEHDEQCLTGFMPELVPHDARKPIEGQPEIDRSRRDQDPRWELELHGAAPPIAITTRISSSCAVVRGSYTRSTCPAADRSSQPDVSAGSVSTISTGTSLGFESGCTVEACVPSFHFHHDNVETLSPCRAAKACADRPLCRQSETSFAHFVDERRSCVRRILGG